MKSTTSINPRPPSATPAPVGFQLYLCSQHSLDSGGGRNGEGFAGTII